MRVRLILFTFLINYSYALFAQEEMNWIRLPLKRASIEPETIESMIRAEGLFRLNDTVHQPPDKNWFEYLPGTSKVLLLAPHATSQIREGSIKRADSGTGSLAIVLHGLNNCPILYTTYLSPSDPNYYDNNAFKDTLKALLNSLKPILVLDLHASNSYRPYDIDFGTMKGTSYLTHEDYYKRLIQSFSENGLTVLSQDRFPADKNQTNTKFVKGNNIPCIQLEINSTWFPVESANYLERSFYGHRSAQLLQAISNFINEIDGK